jgi:hypothetical protein
MKNRIETRTNVKKLLLEHQDILNQSEKTRYD